MGKLLFRRAAVGILAAAAAVGLSTLFAAPASAHTAGVAGKAECVDADGSVAITWTLTNDYNKEVTLSNFKLSPADASAKFPSSIDATQNGKKTTVQFTSNANKDDKFATVEFDAKWSDNYHQHVTSDKVSLTGPCPSPSPSKSPSKPPEATTPPAATPSASVPGLPVTGTSNTLPLVGTGAALVAGGAALVFAIRRRRQVRFTAE
ncbi:LPXTG cell wall anchor domain-containing protein [Dactylosporangium sucinum]|uniref:LPXTG-motif cell wall anchor domain-containing protein n=1 Tax=Dactylosporangium sucinum TaxID=1424081 RepID=A0A917UFN3_9ACTN|nr:LPXTG cell wall anchor domain-containing protein [Dactylosporangium sucinum]GGM89432.1 hypothetical protein GCM10007977_109300 [Dactylosporangium sucinum]